MPDVPEPTSFGLTKNFHITSEKIINKVLKIMNINHKKIKIKSLKYHDQPGKWFKGPLKMLKQHIPKFLRKLCAF